MMDLAKTAGSWRGLVGDGPVWADHPATLVVDQQGGGRQSYEVYVYGKLIGRGRTVDDGKAMAEKEIGPLTWRRARATQVEAEHYYFGPTTEFTDPPAYYIGEPY